MNAAEQNSLPQLLGRLPQAAALIAVAVGAFTLLGWVFDVAVLKSVVPGLPPMKANVTVAHIMMGVSLWIAASESPGSLFRNVAQFCAGAVLLIALATLGEYLSGMDFGIDQLLVRDVVNYPSDIPGRMSTRIALCLAMLAAALLLLVRNSSSHARAVQALAFASLLIALSGLVGYAYGIGGLHQVRLAFSPMSLHAAATLALLGFAIVIARPEYVCRHILTSDGLAGISTRRLLPAIIGFPFVTGWLILQGQQAGYFGETVGLAIFAVTNMGGLTVIALWDASSLMRLDIRRKQAEEQVRALNRDLEVHVEQRTVALSEAIKDLEGFNYSVSHDLRVPLRAIDGFSQQVLKHYADKLDDEGKRYLNVVRDNTKKMSQLIDDILAFSRTGRLDISMSEISMDGLAREVFEELRPNFAGRELTMEIKPLPPAHGDQAMLRQVLINLIGNAIKFTRPKEAARIEMGGYTEGAESVYYIKDNGVGFDMQYADKLFGVFQRLHGVEEFEGTGIGLAIVKRIITRHGGRVWAEGKVDEGATFYFALPIREKSI